MRDLVVLVLHLLATVARLAGPGGARSVVAKDSLWSLDLFRCESAALRTHWVLVMMYQCTRRIVGFGVHRGVVDGVALCQVFNRAIWSPTGADLPQLGP